MSFRFSLSSFLRILVFITLCIILAHCFLEIILIHVMTLREHQRVRFPVGGFKNMMDGATKPERNIISKTILSELKSKSVSNHCSTGLRTTAEHKLSDISTDWNTWTYKQNVKCPKIFTKELKLIKSPLLLNIQCDKRNISHQVKTTVIATANGIQAIPFGSPCLYAYLDHCCRTDTKPVPNIVHYIWYGDGRTFSFYGVLSFISVIRFVRPCVILIHGDTLPSGFYWNFVSNLYSNYIHVTRKIQPHIYGKKPKYINHFGDIIRIEALLKYGGIYLDLDMVLLKEIDFLRKYHCTMSRMRSYQLQSSFIMATKNSVFLQKWQDGYKYHYRNDLYIYSVMMYPNQIAEKYSNLIHIERETLSRPWSQRRDTIYYTNFDWSWLYGIHLFNRLYKAPDDEKVLRQMNTTFGAIARHILYGNKELCAN